MKKVTSIIAIIMLFCFAVPAFAFLNDNSIDNTGTMATAENAANSNLMQGDINSGNTNTAIGAPIPGSVGYGPLINYFGKPLPSSGFQPLQQLLMYSCWFTEGALQNMLKGVEDAESEFKIANTGLNPAPVSAEDGKTRWIKIIIQPQMYAAQADFVGYLTARSDNAKTTMTEVMAKAGLDAIENGCNVLHLTAQGAVRDAFAKGWGIGFASTQAQIHGGNDDRSNVSVGGFGYSSGSAGMRDKPWLQGFGLIDRSLTYPKLRPVKTELKQVILNNVKAADSSELTEITAEKTPVEQKIEMENATLIK